MQCTVRSAERVLFDGDVDRVVARSPHGEFAVMDGHAPLLAVLAPGPVRLHSNGEERVIVCRGGGVEVAHDHVTLLVEKPVDIGEIDVAALRAQLSSDPVEGPRSADEIEYLEMLCRVKERYG